jgi:outer membrane protein assembly factor BamA
VSSGLLSSFPGLSDFTRVSNIGALAPTVSYDSRNNLFTPTDGTFVEGSAGIFTPELGSDTRFNRSNLTAIHYRALNKLWTLGVFTSGTSTSGDVPFYLRPFLTLRGAPAMRYQGESTLEIEAEMRWQFWGRLSLVGFAGAGSAHSRLHGASNDKNIVTGGVGVRYEIARKHGLHMGLDFAAGPDSKAVYVQFGSAWLRP